MKSDKSETLWQNIIDIVRRSPEQSAALELETNAYLLLTILGFEISSGTVAVIYHSAIEGENLEWLVDRLEYERSRAS